MVWRDCWEGNSESNCNSNIIDFYPIGRADIQTVCTQKVISIVETLKLFCISHCHTLPEYPPSFSLALDETVPPFRRRPYLLKDPAIKELKSNPPQSP